MDEGVYMKGNKRILLFGGTTEGRKIAESGLPVFYSVTTDFGAELADFPNVEPIVGRMDAETMADFITSRPVAGVIDATHPYAAEVSENIRLACERTHVPFVRVIRKPATPHAEEITAASSCEKAAMLLNEQPWSGANVLLTVGSKELASFTNVVDYRKRLFARVLPKGEILLECEKLGFDAGHVIAMKGPFTKAINKAMLQMIDARVLVTKDGGAAGGLEEKLSAAKELGVNVLLIRRPEEFSPGMTVAEATNWGFDKLSLARPRQFPFFPLFTDISGRWAVVIGGGKVAARRVKTLLTCGARVTVISPSLDPAFDEPEFSGVERLPHTYQKGDLKGFMLAVAAASDRNANRQAGLEAKELGIPVSVADAPDECTFFFPSLIESEGIAAAVSTGGRSPAICRRLADRLRDLWPGWVEEEMKP
jgi:precorrin-2 dehydrogenase/sirohydrochlorin ferrochelatase/precorrin-6A/cobalt-precorrin-6A reductase